MAHVSDEPVPLLLERDGHRAVMDAELFENLLHMAEILGMAHTGGIYPDDDEHRAMIADVKTRLRDLVRRWEDTPDKYAYQPDFE